MLESAGNIKRSEMVKKNRDKAAILGGIVSEIFSALEEFSIDKITEVINELYNSCYIIEDFPKSIFLTLLKWKRASQPI